MHAFLHRAAAGWLGMVILVMAPASLAADNKPTVETLLVTEKTVLDQKFTYPTVGQAKVTAAIVTLQAGQETGWHRHDVPLFGHILDGELTVDYGKRGTRVYRTGDSVMEAIDWPHNGRNSGSGALRILVVFIGAEGIPNTTAETASAPPPAKPK